jgi:hypothetical protein
VAQRVIAAVGGKLSVKKDLMFESESSSSEHSQNQPMKQDDDDQLKDEKQEEEGVREMEKLDADNQAILDEKLKGDVDSDDERRVIKKHGQFQFKCTKTLKDTCADKVKEIFSLLGFPRYSLSYIEEDG